MAVVVSIARGHDASYPFRTIGSADGATVTGQRGSGYYLSAVEKGGEPAGTWIGNGADDLGICDGNTVRREDFEPLYGQFLDPRDPSGQMSLGRPPRVNAELAAIYRAKLAGHPGATADERMRLLTEARAENQGPVGVQYFDTTFSVDKTISLAHASALASALEAQQAGDPDLAAEWEARAAGIWAEIEKSVRLYIAHMQSETRFVRTGHHGRRIDGVEPGRFEDAEEIPVAIFPQHTSRNGDPQLHVHVLWLNRVKSVRDGHWRSIDSRGLYREKGAGSALAAFALESGLTRRFGFGWSYRPASKGRVIAGFPEKVITQFSSRRTQITKTTLALAQEYESDRGHAPDQRALASMRQFANARTRNAKEAGALDFKQLLRDWEQISRHAEVGTLRDLATAIWPRDSDSATMAEDLASRGELTHAQERAAMAAGLAQVQESQSAWRRSGLIHCIAQHLPDHAIGRDQDHALQILENLTMRALAGEGGEDVLRLNAPEWPRVPDSLRRANGESIYRPHGVELYATRSQLSLEEQLIAQAQQEAAPHLPRGLAARLLGADLTQLETLLNARGPALEGTTRTGLRLDQATASFLALTSLRCVELIVGPAGTGKTYTAVRIAAAWRAADMGRVYGIATTSAGRNVLAEAGVDVAENTAQFLGHLPDRREARGATTIGPNALLILDEASMTSTADLAAIIRHATRMSAKVIITGDHAQLIAVEAGGGMGTLARKLGYALLTEAMRFQHEWERAASLALRAGHVPTLGIYDEHGRLHGGSYDEMAEQASRAYLTEYLSGTDVILTASRRKECADLSRRIQDYLLDWGQLRPGLAAALRGDARAYAGDLIVARQNDNHLAAGEHDRTVANGDLMRVDAVGEEGLTVRRLNGYDAQAGRRTWSAPFPITKAYAAESCDLGYALTCHTIEGRTVSVGITLASDAGTRAGLYVAMSRGRDRNEVYAYPAAPDVVGRVGQAPMADPEVARQHRLQAEREGSTHAQAIDTKDPISILARVLRRGDAELSAVEAREQSLSNADHLGALYAIWQDQCRIEAAQRYTLAVRDTATVADAEEILKDTDVLWRTVQAAELAGKDGREVLRDAIAGRSFTGARSHSALLNTRVRKTTGHLPPKERESWVARLPTFADHRVATYMGEIAAAMDDRQRRIGEHATREQPTWATQALGDVPAEPGARAEWERRVGKLAAYREITGYGDPDAAIGPEPASSSPEARAEWHTAFAVMARVEGIDVRGLSDGHLLGRRHAYEAETSWAPQYVAEELRAARRQEQFSRIEATRHTYEASGALRRGDSETAALHRKAAESWIALGERAAGVREKLAEAHDTRCQWEAITETARRLARAADIELKRRGVLGPDDQLRSAEPQGFAYPEHDKAVGPWVQPRLDGSVELATKREVLSRASREERALEVLGLTPDHDQPELPVQVSQILEYNRQRQAQIDELRAKSPSSRKSAAVDLENSWSTSADRQKDAVLHPPRPQIPAARQVLELAAEREAQ